MIPGYPGRGACRETLDTLAEVKSIADGLRHSYRTYHLALHEDANKTANQMGHRGNTDLVFSHYRMLVPKEYGTALFEILAIRRC
jgi:hypothetical protein